MKASGHSLEFKYVGYRTELNKYKRGEYDFNVWNWIIRLKLYLMLRKRYQQLKYDFKHGLITKQSFISGKNILNEKRYKKD